MDFAGREASIPIDRGCGMPALAHGHRALNAMLIAEK
jgi:hypothetical protein